MILPQIRDKRFITVCRGGTLSDEDHRLLASWAAECAQHVLHYFEKARPDDDRPRRAIEAICAWVNGEITMKQARFAAGASQDAAREAKGVSETARLAALSAGQAAVVAHVAAHELGAAAYAIRSVMADSPANQKEICNDQYPQGKHLSAPDILQRLHPCSVYQTVIQNKTLYARNKVMDIGDPICVATTWNLKKAGTILIVFFCRICLNFI